VSDDLKRSLELDPSISAVEVKITAQMHDEDTVRSVLEGSGADPEHREVFFFDTPELGLFDAGVVLRARLTHDGTDDSTVKLRPVDPTTIADDWKNTDGFEIELDSVGDTTICSAKLSVDQDRNEIRQVGAGERPLRKLFSKDQERLILEHAPAEVSWEDLTVLGPVQVRKWKLDPKAFAHDITAEEWVLPDGSDLIELSIKVEPGESDTASEEFLAFLRSKSFDTEGDQQTKTRGALRFFTTGEGLD